MSAEQAMLSWLNRCNPGDAHVYYTGCCIGDTYENKPVQGLAYNLALDGVVYLVQRRIKHLGKFNYIAIKASSPPVKNLVPKGTTASGSRNYKPRSNDSERANQSGHGIGTAVFGQFTGTSAGD